jgi:hypothetical protein
LTIAETRHLERTDAMDTNSPDRMSMRVWLMLAILGAVLCIVGWYRYAG